MPTVALRVSDGKLDSRVQQLRIALLPFCHRCHNDEITFPQPNLIFRRVEANFNALAVEKPLRISALTLSTGRENTSLLRMLIRRRFRVGRILGFCRVFFGFDCDLYFSTRLEGYGCTPMALRDSFAQQQLDFSRWRTDRLAFEYGPATAMRRVSGCGNDALNSKPLPRRCCRLF